MLRANSKSASPFASKAQSLNTTPRLSSKQSAENAKCMTPRISNSKSMNRSEIDSKSLKSSVSKETTKIPKPKSSTKDPRPSLSKVQKLPPEEKKFSIRRTSKTILETKAPKTDVSNRPSTTSSLGKNNSNFGKVPAYLKRSNSTKTEPNINDKVKSFLALKTKLRDAQSQFFKALENIKETQPDGLREQYKFVAFVKDGEGKLIVEENKGVPKIDGGLENKNFLVIKEKLSSMAKDMNMVLGSITDQLKTLQNNPTDMELSGIKYDFSGLQQKIESFSSVNKSHTVEVIKLLNNMADSSSLVVREIDNQELESKLHNITTLLETTKRKLEVAEGKLSEFRLKDQSKHRDFDAKNKEKLNFEKDKEIIKLKGELKIVEEQKHKSGNELVKLKNKMKILEAELEKYKLNASDLANIETLKSDLQKTLERKEELEVLYNQEITSNTKLQEEVRLKEEELSNKILELEEIKGHGDSTTNNIAELSHEIKMLKFEKGDLKEELDRLREEKISLLREFESSNANLQAQYSETMEKLDALGTSNTFLQNKLQEVEKDLNEKNELVKTLEAKINDLNDTNKANKIQNELKHLRESDFIKSQEIKTLKLELAKAIHDIKQREEEVMLYQRVLKVRSELITSMQEKEHSSDLKISDLYSEIGKQSNYINQINTELSSKAEELQNIFSNLEKKKVELAHQEDIMRRLEESNKKNYEIQKTQVVRIQQLDTEIAKLKESVQVYEKHLLGINDSNRERMSQKKL